MRVQWWVAPMLLGWSLGCSSANELHSDGVGGGGSATATNPGLDGRGGSAMGSAGEPGNGGAGASSPMPGGNCAERYEACSCGEGLEGYLFCDEQDTAICNCDAPVQLGPLSNCMTPCGGDVVDDWILTSICPAQFALGNCEHSVHDAVATPLPSGLTFTAEGSVTGNLSYDATLFDQQTELCSQRLGFGLSSAVCSDLEQTLFTSLQSVFGVEATDETTCSYDADACSCQLDVSPRSEIAGTYTAQGTTLSMAGTALEYCVAGDTLNLRSSESDFTFAFERSRITLPYNAPPLGSVQNAPAPASAFEVGANDCEATVTLNTDTLTADCASDRILGTTWEGRNVFFMRGLVVPEQTHLVFEGIAPAIVVAEWIDIRGAVTFEPTQGSGTGAGGSGADQAGGGGGHCTAGGAGAAWTNVTPKAGGMVFGTATTLSFGGNGGSADYTYTPDIGLGGKGGGAIALLGAVSVNISGTIDVAGRSGTTTGPTPQYGGGGGAGGTLIIEAPSVTVTAIAQLLASGANGAGYEGGAGSTTSSASGGPGGTQDASVQSGGGGGAGRISIYSNDVASISTAGLVPNSTPCVTVAPLATLGM